MPDSQRRYRHLTEPPLLTTIATVALALFAAAWATALIVGLSAGLADASVSGSAPVVLVDAESVWRARDEANR